MISKFKLASKLNQFESSGMRTDRESWLTRCLSALKETRAFETKFSCRRTLACTRTRAIRATLITAGPTAGTAAYNAPRRFIYHARTRKSPVKCPRAAPLGPLCGWNHSSRSLKAPPFPLKLRH